MVVGMSNSTNAETVEVMDEASTDGSFTIAQTSGMERRGERRDTRQNCRQANGAVGADQRHCKQTGRQNQSGHCRVWRINVIRVWPLPPARCLGQLVAGSTRRCEHHQLIGLGYKALTR